MVTLFNRYFYEEHSLKIWWSAWTSEPSDLLSHLCPKISIKNRKLKNCNKFFHKDLKTFQINISANGNNCKQSLSAQLSAWLSAPALFEH